MPGERDAAASKQAERDTEASTHLTWSSRRVSLRVLVCVGDP